MMKKKNWLAALLAGALVLSMAACGGNSDAGSSAPSESSQPESSAPEADAPAGTPTESESAPAPAAGKFPYPLPSPRQLAPLFRTHLREDKPPRFHVRKKVDAQAGYQASAAGLINGCRGAP